ncbi:hypothetical protein VTO42DRAFT_7033 [Malbranchea cinnamomea]
MAVNELDGTNVPMVLDPRDQETCTPNPSSASVNPLPTDQLLDNEIDGHAAPNSDYAMSNDAPAETPAQVAQGFSSGAELLRRLSLVNASQEEPSLAHPQDHPDLDLSGRIISAAFCIPYKLGFQPGEPWVLNHRPGMSALFDSFAYLNSPDVPWQHTLVAWTGEIERLPPPHGAHGGNMWNGPSPDVLPTVPLNKASAPIPVDPLKKPPQPPQNYIRVTHEDRERLEQQLQSSKFGKILPVWLSDECERPEDDIDLKDQGRWRRFAERIIFPIFHYKPMQTYDGRSTARWWKDYVRLNQMFADRILKTYRKGDVVWVHDYHLFLLPALLRQAVPNIYIGFYLHVPFPSSEFLRCLSRRKDILTGMLGANMIAFQSFTYSRHFASCCTRILRFESSSAGIDAHGAHVAVDAFPIGIDVDKVLKVAFDSPDVEKTITEIRKIYGDKKVIVGRDRLDSIKGVTQKLMAFENFLERYPEWRDKVVLIQVTSPTSVEEEKVESEAKLSSQMSHLVSTINGRYGSLNHAPIQHYPQYISQSDYFALLRTADLGLITSVRDGMNTTSLEYVICQKENHSPLIISEFSGTAGSLSTAIHINPWDTRGVADAIHQALNMSDEAKARQHAGLYNWVVNNTVQSWTNLYLKRLLTNLSSFNQSIVTPQLDTSKLVQRYLRAKRRLFMFDYDGTLTPIVKDPQAAIPSDRVIRTIKTLAADSKNAVWIISGRDQNFLEQWMGHIPELGLSAEHGCFMRKPNEEHWENLAATLGMEWRDKVKEIFEHYSHRTQGSHVEEKEVAITWHYRNVDPEYGAFQARECRKHLEDTVAREYDLEVMAGKANLEVRPRLVNKGGIVARLVNEYGDGTGQEPDFVFCSGDDFTDEDMFRALKASTLRPENVFSVTIGASSKQTEASWHLLEPADVIATIQLLSSSQAALEG